MRAILSAAILLLAGSSALAHRLDEYLQATLISVDHEHVRVEIRLTPGVTVLPLVLSSIDTNADGVISEAEERAYAERVIRDVSLTLDGERRRLRLVLERFPKVEELKAGLGEIQLVLNADMPRGGSCRRLIFENHHQSQIGVYLVNCLVPRDPDIRITGQNRNYPQSFYELDYVQAGGNSNPMLSARFADGGSWLGAAILLLLARLAFYWRPLGLRRLQRIAMRPGGKG